MSNANPTEITSGFWSRRGIHVVCLVYLLAATIFGSMNLDTDEFSFVREPYELLGGDYTTGYLKEGEFLKAGKTLVKAYYFYWKYRPINAPLISEEDKGLFRREEAEFGYIAPAAATEDQNDALNAYKARLIVPEPDRFYSHGAGKPLLPAILSLPQLAIVKTVLGGKNLLDYQYHYNYHPIFIVARLVQIFAGLATIWLVYYMVAKECGKDRAILGASLMALFPTCIRFFPNIHHDSILVPFLVASMYFFYKEQYKRAGLSFGLALAAKNVAIFFAPAFFIAAILQAGPNGKVGGVGLDLRGFLQKMKGWLLAMALSFAVLFPFANPVSYVAEILTPITHRAADPRGEDVEQFSLLEKSEANNDKPASTIGHSIKLVSILTRLQDNSFFFVVLAVFLFFGSAQHLLGRTAFISLLMALPCALIFGSYLISYRSLVFVPFFAICCATTVSKKQLLSVVVFLFVFDILYCVDPMSTDPIWHDRVSEQTWWGSMSGGLSKIDPPME